ncbi:MAG: eamA-like transporter family protein [Gammaproteobacteria bacterium]|jgi:drug/metabolite transporter (DMT)-like permease|nr:eamA-like transporter family protein [Gammaproteobacteria bacterium]
MKLNWISLGLLVLLGLIWGSGYSIARYCVTHGVAPMGYSFWQSLGPALFLLLLACFRSPKLPLSLPYLRYYLMCGILGIAFPNTLMYFAAGHIPAGMLAVLVNTVPIFTYPLAVLARTEKFKALRLAGLFVGLMGIMLIVWPHESLSHGSIPWTLLVLLTPLSFACCAVFASFRPVPSDSLSLSAGMMTVSTLLLAPLVIHFNEFHALSWPLTTVDWLILLEIVLSSIGYVIFFALIKRAGPVYYSLVGGVVSITGLFWAYVAFDEKLSLALGLAVLLILVAIALLSLNEKIS